MKEPGLPSLGALPADSVRRVEKVCSEFETAWKSGQTPRIESRLNSVEEPEYSVLLLELLKLEIAYRVRLGQRPAAGEYQARFPKKTTLITLAFKDQSSRTATGGGKDHGNRETTSASEPLGRDTPAYQSGSSEKELGALPRLFGRYRLLQRLGQGGMGTVYLAHDTELDRQVALKMPRMLGDGDPDLIERFCREARAAATLQHPNLCAIFDVGTIDGRPYYTMALIEGKPLAELIRPDKPFLPAQCATVVRKLALALQQAHDRGVVHRDLKPGNVMIKKGGEPVVVDFGLARRTLVDDARITQSGEMVGTPAYMAPEQVKGDRDSVGPASDIYALGVILFELLTGRLPFQGARHQILTQIESAEAPAVTAYRPDVDPSLVRICKRAMSKRPADRFTSMRDMADELKTYLRDHSRPTAPPPAPASPVRSKRRWPMLMAGFVAMSVIFVAGIVLFWQTPQGLVRIEIDDPKIKVEIDNGKFRFQGADKHELSMTLGEHGLRIQRGDLDFQTEKFVLAKGKTVILKIQLLPGKVQVAQGERILGERVVGLHGPMPPLAIAPFDARLARAHQEAWAQHLGIPVEFANFAGTRLTLIPPGEFMMGSPDSEEIPLDSRQVNDKGYEERPQIKVRITKPLYIGAYEVTQKEYQAVMEQNPSLHQESPQIPVDQVTWEQAMEFCTKLSDRDKKLGLVYRLPSEAEWEYVCRAGTTTAYHCGNTCTSVQANLGGGFPLKKPVPVGMYKPNAWGVHDMHGNVSEWCLDAPQARASQVGLMENPLGAMEPGLPRALRGGFYLNPAGMCRSAARDPGQPLSFRHASIGFRVVAELPGQKIFGNAKSLPPITNMKQAGDHYERGKAAHAKFNYKEAVEEFSEAIRLNKNYWEAYFARGVARIQDSDYAPAILDFTETLRLKPDHLAALDYRMTSYLNVPDYEKALADSEELIRLAPFDPNSYTSRGWAYIAWGGVKGTKAELEKGIEDCNVALRKHGGFSRAFGTRGRGYHKMEQFDKALADYNEAIRLSPGWAWAYQCRGELFFVQKEYAKTIEDYTRSIQLGDRYPFVYELRGCSHYHLGDYDKAIADFSETILLNPTSPWPYQYRSMAYDKKNDSARAKSDRDQATSLNNGVPLTEGNLRTSK